MSGLGVDSETWLAVESGAFTDLGMIYEMKTLK